MTAPKFTLVCAVALLSAQAAAGEKHITIIKPLQKDPGDVSMHLGPAVYSQKEWRSERMPIKVKYKPINDERILPPAEFDHEFNGAVVVTRVDEQGIKAQCPKTFTGCSFSKGETCYVWIVYDDILNYQRYSYDVVLRHEISHCNGWKHDEQGKTIEKMQIKDKLSAEQVEYFRKKNLLPPAEFDRPYLGRMTVLRSTQEELREACKGQYKPNLPILGCTQSSYNYEKCTVYIARDEELAVTGYSFDFILRHETGHCHGWQHSEGRATPQKKLEGWCVVDPSLWMCREQLEK